MSNNTDLNQNNNNLSNVPTAYPDNYPSNEPISFPDNYPSNEPITFPDNYPSNEPITFPDNYSVTNAQDTNKSDTDDESTNLVSNKSAYKAKRKLRSKKKSKPKVEEEEPLSISNNPFKISQNPEVIRFRELFVSNPKNSGYSVYCLDFQSYEKVSTENCFGIFVKNFINKFNHLNSPFNKNLRRSQSTPGSQTSIGDTIYSKSLSIENYTKLTNIEMKMKLNRLKQFYLAHTYDRIPTEINQVYLADQINYYMNNDVTTLAHFHGFSMTDDKDQFVPTVLTDRPVNGPLSSLFETIKASQSVDCQIDYSKYFNIDQIRSINPEQKFAMICGITHAIKLIHEANFIHSNLSPETVYLDENLRPVVCDYIHIPPYKIETLPEKDAYDQYAFNFHFDAKNQNAGSAFKNRLYVAPEVFEKGEISEANDIYSLGLVFYFIIAEKEAKFDDQKALNYPSNLNPKMRQLIEDCVSEDASQRPTASLILGQLFEIKTIGDSKSSPLSESTQNYLTLLKDMVNEDDKIDIIHQMIPNLIDIDVETRYIIKAAEKGDVKQIEKVGDFFYYGHNNIHQDEEWALTCYEKASNGSLRSSLLAGEFNEKGIGGEANFSKAKIYYEKARDQMSQTDERRPKILQKVEEMKYLEKIVIFTNIPNKTTEADIRKKFGFKFNFVIEETIPSQEDDQYKQVKLRFNSKDELVKVKNEIDLDKDGFYSFEGVKIMYESPTVQTSHRFLSLSNALKHIDDLDDYELVMDDNKRIELGKGTTAIIYLVKEKNTNQTYAAKVYTKPLKDDQVTFMKREIITASKFNHPCILKYHCFSEFSLINRGCNQVIPTLIMDYIPNGTLEKAIKRNSEIEKNGAQDEEFGERLFDDTCKLKAIIGLASALNEMFNNNVVHRDLKPENILLNERLEPIICDFGFSKQFSNLEHHKMTGHVGTPIFMAPELFYGRCNNFFYRYEIDVYSFGIIVYQILTNTVLTKIYPPSVTSEYRLIRYKIDNYVPVLPDDMNEIFKELIYVCWNVVKDERPQPPLIFNILVDAVMNADEPLLKGADMDEVRKYIRTLYPNAKKTPEKVMFG